MSNDFIGSIDGPEHLAVVQENERLRQREKRTEIENEQLRNMRQQLRKRVAELEDERDFYQRRVELFQYVQSGMRDPERRVVCDILANAAFLPDKYGDRYGFVLEKAAIDAAMEADK